MLVNTNAGTNKSNIFPKTHKNPMVLQKHHMVENEIHASLKIKLWHFQ